VYRREFRRRGRILEGRQKVCKMVDVGKRGKEQGQLDFEGNSERLAAWKEGLVVAWTEAEMVVPEFIKES
jgi:hypothetical protein